MKETLPDTRILRSGGREIFSKYFFRLLKAVLCLMTSSIKKLKLQNTSKPIRYDHEKRYGSSNTHMR